MFSKKIFLVILGLLLIFLVAYFTINISNKSLILGTSIDNQKSSSNYTLVFVGDSMTEYLGNFDELKEALKKYYPQKKFLLLNYGFSSTNILSIPDRLEKLSDYNGRGYQPINDISFDLIFIESMGNNPLSQFSLEEGLKKQTAALDRIINIIVQKHSKSSIIFVATIAPNKDWYGTGIMSLSPEQKLQWVSERNSYIKNHMEYAKSHNIALIDIFDKSLDSTGTGNIDYLNSNDFLHPSPTGIIFISQQIADFIYKNNYSR